MDANTALFREILQCIDEAEALLERAQQAAGQTAGQTAYRDDVVRSSARMIAHSGLLDVRSDLDRTRAYFEGALRRIEEAAMDAAIVV